MRTETSRPPDLTLKSYHNGQYSCWVEGDKIKITYASRTTRRNKNGETKYWWKRYWALFITRKPDGTFSFHELIYGTKNRRRVRHIKNFTVIKHDLQACLIFEKIRDLFYETWGIHVANSNDFFTPFALKLSEAPPNALRNTWISPLGSKMLHALQTVDNAQDLTLAMFGKKYYRKDLVKAVASNYRLAQLYFASELRGLVPTEDIINLLKTEEDFVFTPDGYSQFRKGMRALDLNSRRRVIRGRKNFLLDGIRLLAAVKPENYPTHAQSTRDWHDQLLAAYYARKVTARSKKISYPEDFRMELTQGDYRIKFAENTKELVEWGNEMRHCIGVYAKAAVQGVSILGAVYVEDKFKYNFEVRNQHLVQLHGKFNQYPENIDKAAVRSMLQEAKVIR